MTDKGHHHFYGNGDPKGYGRMNCILGKYIEKILSGDLEPNDVDGGNMKKVKFYVCAYCKALS